ncbi:MAG TPA: GDSL-type esterase/lipase family protein [Planctomycetota bacterium]
MLTLLLSLALQDLPGAKPAPKDEKWVKRHEGFLADVKAKPDCGLLFLGDSITDGWRGKKAIFEAAFGAHKPVNLGISGDRTQHVLWRIQNGELEGIKPKAAVIMIGTNNIGQSNPETAASAIAGNQAIVAHLRKTFPELKILLLGVFPRSEKPDHAHRATIKEINDALAKIEGVKFLDIGPKFLAADGTLPKELMPDFLHLSEKGYQIWADAIKADVDALMK